MKKFPMNLNTRLKQLFCKHETMDIGAYTNGINSKIGYKYVIYECGKCGLCVQQWEKER